MTSKIHLPDQIFGARSPSCIQKAFLNSETSSTESPQHTSDCIWAETEDSSTPNNDGTQPLRLDFLFEPVLSLETDPFEQLAPSSPARTPTSDEKERYPCLKFGCDKIFTHLHKLQRHYRDTHGKPQYDCPYPNCTRKGPKGFARKDNMRQHHRLVHNKHLDPKEIPRRKWGTLG